MLKFWRHYSSRARAICTLGLTLAGWLVGAPLSANAAQSVSVGVSAHILNPPNAVTDLTASAVGSQNGDVQLVWTAPSNANGVAIDRYAIRFATFPAANVGAAESWWTSLASSQRGVAPANAPGVTEFKVLTGLTVGVTHYFGIKAIDRDGQISAIDTRTGGPQQAQSLPLQLSGPPLAPASLIAIAESTGSLRWEWSASAGASFYTLNAFPGGAQIVQTPGLQHVEGGFGPNAAVVRTVRAGNGSGLSSNTPARTGYTLAAVPTALNVVRFGAGQLDLAWNAGGNANGTLYRPERSLDNFNFTPLPIVSTPTIHDTGLQTLTSYYYRVVAINGDGVQTAASSTLTVFTPPDVITPRFPMGLKGSLSGGNQTFTLTWDPVLKNEDSTAIEDLAGYHVYRRSVLGGPATRLTGAPITTPAFADTTNGQTFFYTVRAVDTSGNESDESLYADSSVEENVIFLGSDGYSSVRMPEDVNNLLRAEFNKYGVSLTLLLVEEPVPSATEIVRNVRLQLIRGDTLAPVNDLSFTRSAATISVGFSLVGNQVGVGEPSAAPGPALAGVTPDQLALFWFNGVDWLRLGGVLDLPSQTVSVRTAFLGNYQLRAAARATSLSLDKANVYPRVFTPNGDGLNDRVYFVLENPNGADVRGEIFDKEGRRVAPLIDATTLGGIGTTLIWDGRDASGNVVPGGAYLYRIQGEGRSFTGSVGVAR